MKKIKNVLYYFTLNYPCRDELSKTRLTKMVYLADWYSAVKYGKQITNIEWFFNHYGPFVPDVYEVAHNDKYLSIENSFTVFGSPKEIITINYKNKDIELNRKDKEILQKVIDDTKKLSWSDFINKVYSTYPVKNQSRYKNLDLENLAKFYLKGT